MDTPLKQRLIGLAVLIALAVIFLPMVLDGSGTRDRRQMRLELPPEPVYELPDRLRQAGAEEASEESDTAPTPPQVQAEPATAQETPRETPVRALARALPEPEDEPPVAEPTPESAAPVKSETALAKPEVPAAWVVQVGSFGAKNNAEALRDKLRKRGYAAFVEPYPQAGKTMYRVKIGPEIKRETADGLRERLEKKEQLKGIVVAHH